MMLKNLRTVNQWYEMPTTTSDTVDTLEKVFQNVTGEGSPVSYFFQDIYVPILTRDENHAPLVGDDGNFVFTYQNVGLTTSQLTDAYMTLYGYNMLSVPLVPPQVDAFKYATSVSALSTKMKSIFLMNKYKYLKWIDSMGYAYNPLWNVDGSDSFQYIDSHGNVTRTNTPILQTSQNLQTAPYDNSNTYVNTSMTTNTYSGTQSTDTETHADILPEDDNTINGPVHAITGGDYSHIEKRVRQGNIGVTQTSELIRNERELVRFNLVQEFFNDVNKQLLVGIYPGF